MRVIISVVLTLVLYPFCAPALPQQSEQRPEAIVAHGDSLLSRGELQAAEESYKSALKMDRNFVAAYLGVGKVSLQRENWGEAGDHFGDAIERDAENIEAHYYRGICYRETGKSKALFLRKIDWDKSQKHFQWVMSKDSLYKDVFYQYARLLRYRGKYTEAIDVGHEQIRLRPELVRPQVGLFRLYRYSITHKGESEVLNWLKHQPSDHAAYFVGEKLRRERILAQADSVFQRLLGRSLSIPPQPIYLSLARVHYELGESDLAESYFWRAVDGVEDELGADLVFEDLKYILTEAELEEYRDLDSVDQWISFFHRFWVSRDPTPAAKTNVRLAEHYARLLYAEQNYEYDGFRTWFNSPDKLNYLDFPETYKLNHEYNDKGLIYIRHGEPDDNETTVAENVPTNESWRYFADDEHPELIFHFLIDAYATGNNWRLAPTLSDRQMLSDRVTWSTIYHRMLYSDELEQLSLSEEMARESQMAVKVGMSTDRHTWERDLKPLDMPYSIASFRGQNGDTRVEVYYGLDPRAIGEEAGEATEGIEIEKGLAVHDLGWQPVARTLDTLAVGGATVSGGLVVDLLHFSAPPDSYHVAFHARPLRTHLLGGWKIDQRFPDFSGNDLELSDIELASKIEETTEAGPFAKEGLHVIPDPRREFVRDQPLYLYFEVYNLSADSAGAAEFSLQYTLTLLHAKSGGLKKLFGLFGGGGKSSIRVQTDRQAVGTMSREHLAIDASKLKPGEYTLAVDVVDKRSRQNAGRETKLQLE